jgi:hypothetical protein
MKNYKIDIFRINKRNTNKINESEIWAKITNKITNNTI